MKRYFEFLWRLTLTPFYLVFIAGASAFVYLADGKNEFKKFWRDNT